MRPAAFHGAEGVLLAGLVAAHGEDVGDAQELEVEEHVFDFLAAETAAHEVRHHGDVVFLHDGARHGNRAGTASDAVAQEAAVRLGLVDVFLLVRGDVDVLRAKHLQHVDCAKQGLRAVALERRQHLEGQAGRFGIRIDEFCDGHMLTELKGMPARLTRARNDRWYKLQI